jgi:hypothetical protein
MNDIRQSENYARYLASIGWNVYKLEGVYYYIKRILFFNTVKVQRPKHLGEKLIAEIISRHKPFNFIIEPVNNNQVKLLNKRNFKLSKSPYLPTKTLIINLTKSKRELLRGLKKDARYALNKTNSTKFSEVKNLKEFYDEWKRSVGIKRIIPTVVELRALKNTFLSSSLLLTSHNDNGTMMSGAIFLISESTAYYWQAFTNPEGRATLAQYRLVWEGILWAKKKGCRTFDFEGIYDLRFPAKSWLGFTHFKKSFGGSEVKYPGTFVKTVFS